MEEEFKYEKPELSDSTLPDPEKGRYGETDFNCELAMIMLDNEEYQHLLNEENFGIPKETEDTKNLKGVNNVYDIRNFIKENIDKIRTDSDLQKSVKRQLEKFKKFAQGDTEQSLLMQLEMFLNDLEEEAE